MFSIFRNHLIVFFSLCFVSIILYMPSMQGEFISDDFPLIVDHSAILILENIGAVWRVFNTRFLTGLTFAVNNSWHSLNPLGYHIFNVFLHALNAMAVCMLALRLIQVRPEAFNNNKRAYLLGICAAVIFLIHPIQTQAVSFISQRSILLATSVYLWTAYLYAQYLLTRKTCYYLCSLGLLTVGLLTKETIATLPIALFIMDMILFEKKWNWGIFRRIIPFFMIVCLLPFIFLLDAPGSALGLKSQVQTGGFSFKIFLTALSLLPQYARLIILPIDLKHVYHISFIENLWDIRILFMALFLLLSGYLIWRFKRSQALLSFVIIWYFLTNVIEWFVITIVQRQFFFEHWLYLPMAGVSIGLAYLIITYGAEKKPIRIVAISLLLIWSVMTFQRNQAWRTEIGFWQDNLKKAPQSAFAYLGLSDAFSRKGFHQESRAVIEDGIRLSRKPTKLINNLGLIYLNEDKYEQALEEFSKAIKLDPDFAKAENNLAYTYFLQNQFQKAVEHYHRSILLQGPYVTGYYYLAQSYFQINDYQQGSKYLDAALTLARRVQDQVMVEQIEYDLNQWKEKYAGTSGS